MFEANELKQIFIDPSYRDFYQNKLFDLSDTFLNRDDQLQPSVRLKRNALELGYSINTADYMRSDLPVSEPAAYFSMGILTNYKHLIGNPNIKLEGFVIMEPPAVAPHLYRALPELSKYFEKIFMSNIEGDGYSLLNVDQSKLKKFYWPQPFDHVLEQHWSMTARQNRIVVINGNHIPRSLNRQLYGKRIEAMCALSSTNKVDLYGHGWSKWWSHRSMWPPYWLNFKTLKSIYRGSCASKYEVLGGYNFCLCFENMAMSGYVTEKIFDCLYAGCIPIYLGAPNIEEQVPRGTFIDAREFKDWQSLADKVFNMPDTEITKMRNAGRAFIEGREFLKYYNSMEHIILGSAGPTHSHGG